ncbi:hypothetical protein J3B02_005365, partial [Coemansia erecta]
RSATMLAFTGRRAPTLCFSQTVRVSSLLHASRSHIKKTFQKPRSPAQEHPRLLSTTSIANPFTCHSNGRNRNYDRDKGNAEDSPAFSSTNTLLPVGIVGGIALFFFTKRKGPVYSEASFDIGRPEASMRLKILHEQSTKMAKQMITDETHAQKQQAEETENKERVDDTRKRANLSLITHMIRLLAPECWLFLGVALTAVGAAVVNLWTPVVTGDLINVIAR